MLYLDAQFPDPAGSRGGSGIQAARSEKGLGRWCWGRWPARRRSGAAALWRHGLHKEQRSQCACHLCLSASSERAKAAIKQLIVTCTLVVCSVSAIL